MRQRASIAMALACQPKMLLADEPTTALDVMVQAQILDLLARLSDELGLALCWSPMTCRWWPRSASRAAVMYAGEIVESRADGELFHHAPPPVHPAAVRGHARPVRARTSGGLHPRRAAAAGPRGRTAARSGRAAMFALDRCAGEHPALRQVGPGPRGRLPSCNELAACDMSGTHPA